MSWRRLWNKISMKQPTSSWCFISRSTFMSQKHLYRQEKHMKTFLCTVMRREGHLSYLQMGDHIFTSHSVWWSYTAKKSLRSKSVDRHSRAKHTYPLAQMLTSNWPVFVPFRYLQLLRFCDVGSPGSRPEKCKRSRFWNC